MSTSQGDRPRAAWMSFVGTMKQREGRTHRADMKREVLGVRLLVLLRGIGLFHLLHLQLRRKQGGQIGDGERPGGDQWKRADVIFEKTLGLACLGHKSGECPLHVSSLGCSLLPQDLVV